MFPLVAINGLPNASAINKSNGVYGNINPILSKPGAMASLQIPFVAVDFNVRDICRLRVRDDQAGLVATNAQSLAQAWAHPEAWPRAIYAGETPVGFLMLEDRTQPPWSETQDEVGLWRLMIDAAFQGMGFGSAALRLAIAQARTRPGVRRMLLSYVPAEHGAGAFYERLGFRETGKVDFGERVMVLEFEPS